MMTLIARRAMTTLAFASVAVAGCGGGGGSDSTPDFSGPSPEGVYAGASGLPGTDVAVEVILLGDGAYWMVWGTRDTDGAFQATNIAQGFGTWAGGGYHANTGSDFTTSPPLAVIASGGFENSTGTLGIGLDNASAFYSQSFQASKSIPGATYSYSGTASLATVSGTWSLQLTTGESANVNVSTAGDVGGVTTGGCQFTGKVTPRAAGQNLYNVSLSFSATACTLASQTLSGIGLAYPLASGKTQLVVAAVNGARTFGVAGSATR